MAKGKKYDYRIVADKTNWTAEITRRKTSREVVVSKRQQGFASESDAKAWGESELKSFLQNLVEKNKLRSENRKVSKTQIYRNSN